MSGEVSPVCASVRECPLTQPGREADELRVAERSTFESNIYVQPEEAAERGVMRCCGT